MMILEASRDNLSIKDWIKKIEKSVIKIMKDTKKTTDQVKSIPFNINVMMLLEILGAIDEVNDKIMNEIKDRHKIEIEKQKIEEKRTYKDKIEEARDLKAIRHCFNKRLYVQEEAHEMIIDAYEEAIKELQEKVGKK